MNLQQWAESNNVSVCYKDTHAHSHTHARDDNDEAVAVDYHCAVMWVGQINPYGGIIQSDHEWEGEDREHIFVFFFFLVKKSEVPFGLTYVQHLFTFCTIKEVFFQQMVKILLTYNL